MIIKEVCTYLETIAPLVLQESYDNAGLIVGDENAEVTGVLISLDTIESVVDEAIRRKCNLIVSHHPILFSGLKKITGKNYIERTIIKAIRNNIAIYASHTNLDNVSNGVNARIAAKLGLTNGRILSPKPGTLKKLVTYCPVNFADDIRSALFRAGGGAIGKYDECSFSSEGTGSFRASEHANPFVGAIGERHYEKETRVEIVYFSHLEKNILSALLKSHPYEEVAYDLYSLSNTSANIGSGFIGEIINEMTELDFLKYIKEKMQTDCIRYSPLTGKKIKSVAICGGSGSFLLNDAIRSGADIFITADYKYHQFFDADNKILIADIGHYESEQFTKDLFYEFLNKKNYTFAIHLSEMNTNPINYL